MLRQRQNSPSILNSSNEMNKDNTILECIFDKPHHGATPGQLLVMYDLKEEECFGGAVITTLSPTLFSKQPCLSNINEEGVIANIG